MYTAPPPLARYDHYPRLVFLGWVGLTLSGGVAFTIIAGMINSRLLWDLLAGLELQRWYHPAAVLAASLLVGLGVAAAQWPILRKRLARPAAWLALSAVGSGIGALPAIVLLLTPLPTQVALTSGLLTGAAQGGLLAGAQSLALRHRYVQTRWWVAASLLAGAWRWELQLRASTSLESLLFTLLGWLLAGSLTGIALVWIMTRNDNGSKLDVTH